MVDHTKLSWRWMYWVVTILDAVALLGILLFYKPPTFTTKHGHEISRWAQVKQLDYIGLFLFISGFVLFLLGLSWGGSSYPWRSAAVISTIVIGAFLIVALGFWEAFAPIDFPLLPPRIFRNKRE